MSRVLAPSPSAPPLPPSLAVGLMGVSQIVGYGTVFYAFSTVAPHLAAEFGVSPSAPFAALSAAMLTAGLAAPVFGRLVDRIGGPRVMSCGSAATGGIYLLLAAAPSFPVAAALIVALQVAATTALYGSSFPTLARFGPRRGKRAIVHLSLISAFASTIFWPFGAWLAAEAGWRGALLVFAALHLLLALPAHLFIAGRRIEAQGAPEAETAAQRRGPVLQGAESRRRAFLLMAASFSLTGIVSAGFLAHTPLILERAGLGAEAWAMAALVGPAMILARAAEAVFWPDVHPLHVSLFAAACFPLAALALLIGLPPLIGGGLFTLLYGLGHGLNVVAAGTLPLRVFGLAGYGELLGRLNAARALLSAAAPALLALGLVRFGVSTALLAAAVLGLAGVAPLLALGRLTGLSTEAKEES